MKILIVGVGYVGLVTGACFADMGNEVICLDVDQEKVNSLNKGELPFYEPGLKDLVANNVQGERLSFTTNYHAAKDIDVIFIAVGTPSKKDGSADLSQIESAAKSLAQEITGYTVIVNKSTAPVGTAKHIKKIIEENINPSSHFDVVSCPEFLKEGSAVEDCMKPDRIVIGSDSEKATKLLKSLYSPFNFNHDRTLIMDIESAELSKYASNAMLATRISFMNELAEICEKVGANIKQVRLGMSYDQRIGYHFLYAGAGYGGSCFPKDVRALCSMGKKLDCETPLIEAVDRVNEKQKKRMSKRLSDYFAKKGGIQGKTIAIWGLSFKPNTDDIREAPALTLIHSLLKKGVNLRLYDPVSMPNTKKELKGIKGIRFCLNEYQAAQMADAIVLMTEWKQFRFVNLKTVLSKMRGNAFFDGRNQYHPQEMAAKGFYYVGVGIPQNGATLLRTLASSQRKQGLHYDAHECDIEPTLIG